MAFDPIQEDCLRLILEDMRRKNVFPLEDAAFIEQGMGAYQTDPSQLIHTDRDRSFHLTARAAEVIDYQIPFLTSEEDVVRQEDLAEGFLREAVELDPKNWDAVRMLAALESPSNDAYVSFLLDHRKEALDDLSALAGSADDPYTREFASDLGTRPYLRWLSALAAQALISGQYRMAFTVAEQCLAIAPHDPGGIRHTGLLALAKLEATHEELAAYRSRHTLAYASTPLQPRRAGRPAKRAADPWTLLAEMSAAYRAYDFDGATETLAAIVHGFPHAVQALYFQPEFPEGVFARVHVAPGSEDELVLALSEATPLLQEGIGSPDNACFSSWIANHDLVRNALGSHAEPSPSGRGGSPEGRN